MGISHWIGIQNFKLRKNKNKVETILKEEERGLRAKTQSRQIR